MDLLVPAIRLLTHRETLSGLKAEHFVGDGSEFDSLREFLPGHDHRALLFIAGLIEGFFRQLMQDILIRYAVVVLSAVLWLGYFGLGRGVSGCPVTAVAQKDPRASARVRLPGCV